MWPRCSGFKSGSPKRSRPSLPLTRVSRFRSRARERVVQGMAIHNPIQHPDRSRSQIHFRTEGWVTSCDTPNRTSIGSELTPQEDNALERRAVPANNSIKNFPWQALIGRRACIIVALGQGKPRTNKGDCRLQTEGAEGEMQGACGATLRTGTGRIRPRPRESLTIDAPFTAAQGAAAPMARDGAGCPEGLWPTSLRALRDDPTSNGGGSAPPSSTQSASDTS